MPTEAGSDAAERTLSAQSMDAETAMTLSTAGAPARVDAALDLIVQHNPRLENSAYFEASVPLGPIAGAGVAAGKKCLIEGMKSYLTWRTAPACTVPHSKRGMRLVRKTGRMLGNSGICDTGYGRRDTLRWINTLRGENSQKGGKARVNPATGRA